MEVLAQGKTYESKEDEMLKTTTTPVTTNYSIGTTNFLAADVRRTSICGNCGASTFVATNVETGCGTEKWCPVCATRKVICEEWRCLNVVMRADARPVVTYSGTELWCPDCVTDKTDTCPNCGALADYRDTVSVNTSEGVQEWCPDCADSETSYCCICDELYADGCIEEYEVYGDGMVPVCEHCANSNTRCDGCGAIIPNEYDERVIGNCVYCPDCADQHREALAEYGHDRDGGLNMPFRYADGTGEWDPCNDTLFLGIEIETDGNDDPVSMASDIMDEYTGYVRCKEDGSLSSSGVEIVSAPCEPLFHLKDMMWERIVRIVRNHGGLSHDASTSCGFHIHMSRNALGGHDTVYRMDRLFHRFKDEFIEFSRRDEGDMCWCRLDDDDLADIPDVKERKEAWEDRKKYQDRYHAINDENHDTVEIRLWRGTLNLETIRATIEFTTALALMCKGMTDELADSLSWEAVKIISDCVLEDAGIPHDDLDNYLVRRGL